MDVIGVVGLILAVLGVTDSVGAAIVNSFDPRYSKARAELFKLAKDLQNELTEAGKKLNNAEARDNYYRNIIASHPLFSDVSREVRLAEHKAAEDSKKARTAYEGASKHLNNINNAINANKVATSLVDAAADQFSGSTDERAGLGYDAVKGAKEFLEKGGIKN